MRLPPALPALLALSIAAAPAAQAGSLASATLQVSILGTVHSFSFPGVGATGTATSATNASLGAGAFGGTQTATLPPVSPTTASTVIPVDKVQLFLSGNAAGSFSGASPAGVAGSALVQGKALLWATPLASLPFLTLPIRLGADTTLTTKIAGLRYTAFGVPWAAGTAALPTYWGLSATGYTPNGGTLMAMTFTQMGSNGLSPNGAGTLVLVSPGRVLADPGSRIPIFSTLTLSYVPEPTTALLLGAGMLGLVAAGRLRALQ
jgi:hypothetical protein